MNFFWDPVAGNIENVVSVNIIPGIDSDSRTIYNEGFSSDWNYNGIFFQEIVNINTSPAYSHSLVSGVHRDYTNKII